MSHQPELVRRAEEFCTANGVILRNPLGSGVHGSVFAVEGQTESGRWAIKVHERESHYCRERDVYLRLKDCGVNDIRGCAVPELLRHDDRLWILAMTVVTRPFVLDFAGAFLDEPADFPPEVLVEWRQEQKEQYGPRWGEVQAILRELESFGVFMADVNPGNISFGD